MNLEHKKRVFSALVGISLLLGIYAFLGHNGVILITIVVSTAAYYEFLSFSGTALDACWFSALAGLALCSWLCLDLPNPLSAIFLAALAVLLHGLWRVHQSPSELLPREFQLTQARVFGLTYMVLFPSFVPKVHALPYGPPLMLFILGVIWLGDIGAYYGGKAFGKHKLSPNISPGKTREGALVALLVCLLWAISYGNFALAHVPAWKWGLIAVLSSVVAQAGDLIESLMKRAYSVKDSGGLIPGHGGVFDRFDSLMLAAPFFYLLLRLC